MDKDGFEFEIRVPFEMSREAAERLQDPDSLEEAVTAFLDAMEKRIRIIFDACVAEVQDGPVDDS